MSSASCGQLRVPNWQLCVGATNVHERSAHDDIAGNPHVAPWSSAACNAGVNAVTGSKPSFS